MTIPQAEINPPVEHFANSNGPSEDSEMSDFHVSDQTASAPDHVDPQQVLHKPIFVIPPQTGGSFAGLRPCFIDHKGVSETNFDDGYDAGSDTNSASTVTDGESDSEYESESDNIVYTRHVSAYHSDDGGSEEDDSVSSDMSDSSDSVAETDTGYQIYVTGLKIRLVRRRGPTAQDFVDPAVVKHIAGFSFKWKESNRFANRDEDTLSPSEMYVYTEEIGRDDPPSPGLSPDVQNDLFTPQSSVSDFTLERQPSPEDQWLVDKANEIAESQGFY